MANTKEILSRIKSIEDTKKITNAMYLISSSKMKKARKNLIDTLPYFETLQQTITTILNNIPDCSLNYFDVKNDSDLDTVKRGYIVITADKGLAGAYNHNVIKLAETEMAKSKENILFTVGQIGRHYFLNKNYTIDMEFLYTAQNPTMHRARVISRAILDCYNNNKLDEVYIIYTKMITPMKEEAQIMQLLPLKKGSFKDENGRENSNYFEYSPSPDAVMSRIVPNYITGIIYGALVESFSSEQFSRMTAMESSTNNAKDMLKELNIIYNRVRQAAITQEITEVVSGAMALRKKK